MPVNQVIVDPSDTWTVVGVHTYDRAAGGILVPPSGAALPGAGTEPGEYFWLTTTNTLYRRNDANTAWEAQTSAPAAHAASHQDGGSDEINVGGLSGVLADRQDADKLLGRDLGATVPNDGDVLQWDAGGPAWEPAEPKHAEGVMLNEAGGGQIIGGGLATVQYDTVVQNTDPSVFALVANELEIYKPGPVHIVASVSVQQTAGGGRTILGAILQEQPPAGAWGNLLGSGAYAYIRNSTDGNYGTCTAHAVINSLADPLGPTIHRVRLAAIRISGTGTLAVAPNTTGITAFWYGV